LSGQGIFHATAAGGGIATNSTRSSPRPLGIRRHISLAPVSSAYFSNELSCYLTRGRRLSIFRAVENGVGRIRTSAKTSAPKFGCDRQAWPARCVAAEVRHLTAGPTPAFPAPLARATVELPPPSHCLQRLAGPALECGDCRVPFSQGDVLNCQSFETALPLSPRHSLRRPHIQRRPTHSLPYRLLTHQHHSRSHQPRTDISHSRRDERSANHRARERTPRRFPDSMCHTPFARKAAAGLLADRQQCRRRLRGL
jgi:hypothetical protein